MKSYKVLKLLNITRPTLSRYVKEKIIKYKVKPNNVFNPIKIKKINELSDVVFFKWQPTDRGCVFQPNSSCQNEIFLV